MCCVCFLYSVQYYMDNRTFLPCWNSEVQYQQWYAVQQLFHIFRQSVTNIYFSIFCEDSDELWCEVHIEELFGAVKSDLKCIQRPVLSGNMWWVRLWLVLKQCQTWFRSVMCAHLDFAGNFLIGLHIIGGLSSLVSKSCSYQLPIASLY